MEESIKVYIQIDSNNCITAVNSSIFLSDTTGWLQIDEGTGDKYSLAEGNYFEKSLEIQPFIYRYKYVNGIVSERTAEEIQADIDSIPKPQPTQEERLLSLESAFIGLLEI